MGKSMGMLKAVVLFLRAMLVTKTCIAFENLALRQQLAVQAQSVKRPKLRTRDRFFWVCLSQLWPEWRSALAIVQPETVIKWHRIEEVKTVYRSPWQNPFVERLIGSVRRECLNHVIVLGEQHLLRMLREYFDYYNSSSDYAFVLFA
jgi:hypothetical protein